MNKKKVEREIDRWFLMPKGLVKRHCRTLGATCIAVYTELAAYVDKDNICKLNYRQIHKKLGITNVETLRCLHFLEDLHVIRRIDGKGTKYNLLWGPSWGNPGENYGGKPIGPVSPYRFGNRLNIIIDFIISPISGFRRIISIKHIMSKTYQNEDYEDDQIECSQDEMDLAYELAEALNDKDAIQMYLSYVHRFPESVLREMLTKVLSVPEEKIRKTRGALFNYLMQQYAQKKKHYPMD